jgi:DNA-directed RNA polymerase subunit RPC12/RpoP
MTWKVVTTAILSCSDSLPGEKAGPPHITYYRMIPAPKPGDIVQCPYCDAPAIVKVTTKTHRHYKPKITKGTP